MLLSKHHIALKVAQCQLLWRPTWCRRTGRPIVPSGSTTTKGGNISSHYLCADPHVCTYSHRHAHKKSELALPVHNPSLLICSILMNKVIQFQNQFSDRAKELLIYTLAMRARRDLAVFFLAFATCCFCGSTLTDYTATPGLNHSIY